VNHARINYGVVAYSNAASAPVDSVGVNVGTGNLSHPLTTNVFRPGVTVTGDYDESTSLLLFEDQPTGSLDVRKDVATYAHDHALGALMVHFHNGVGTKAQRLALKSIPTVKLKLSVSTVKVRGSVTATVTVTGDAGFTPTGTVSIYQAGSSTRSFSGALSGGKRTFIMHPSSVKTYIFLAKYSGDTNYIRSNSSTVPLLVTAS